MLNSPTGTTLSKGGTDSPLCSREPTLNLEHAVVPPALPPVLAPELYTKRFMEKDPQVRAACKVYLRMYIKGLSTVIFAIFAIFSIYWGSLWKIPAHSMRGLIIVSPSSLFCYLSYILSLAGFRRGRYRAYCSPKSYSGASAYHQMGSYAS